MFSLLLWPVADVGRPSEAAVRGAVIPVNFDRLNRWNFTRHELSLFEWEWDLPVRKSKAP